MLWTSGHKRFPMMPDDCRRQDSFTTKTTDTETFLEHTDRIYKEVCKMVTSCQAQAHHKSKDSMKCLRKLDVVPVWYPAGTRTSTPLRRSGKCSRRQSTARYVMLFKSQLAAVYGFVNDGQ